MKKALFIVAFVAIAFLSSCVDDTGVDPSCEIISWSDPYWRVVVETPVATVKAETKAEYGSEMYGWFRLIITVKPDKFMKLAPDSTKPIGDGYYECMSFDIDNNESNKSETLTWLEWADDDVLKFGQRFDYEIKYTAIKSKGHIEFSFVIQDAVTGELFPVHETIHYTQTKPPSK